MFGRRMFGEQEQQKTVLSEIIPKCLEQFMEFLDFFTSRPHDLYPSYYSISHCSILCHLSLYYDRCQSKRFCETVVVPWPPVHENYTEEQKELSARERSGDHVEESERCCNFYTDIYQQKEIPENTSCKGKIYCRNSKTS